jgi:hypothetical protein
VMMPEMYVAFLLLSCCCCLCLGSISYLATWLKDVEYKCGHCGATMLAVWHHSRRTDVFGAWQAIDLLRSREIEIGVYISTGVVEGSVLFAFDTLYFSAVIRSMT